MEKDQAVVRGKVQVKGRTEARTKVAAKAGWAVEGLALAGIVSARSVEPKRLTNGVSLVCSRNVLNAGLRWCGHEWSKK